MSIVKHYKNYTFPKGVLDNFVSEMFDTLKKYKNFVTFIFASSKKKQQSFKFCQVETVTILI